MYLLLIRALYIRPISGVELWQCFWRTCHDKYTLLFVNVSVRWHFHFLLLPSALNHRSHAIVQSPCLHWRQCGVREPYTLYMRARVAVSTCNSSLEWLQNNGCLNSTSDSWTSLTCCIRLDWIASGSSGLVQQNLATFQHLDTSTYSCSGVWSKAYKHYRVR